MLFNHWQVQILAHGKYSNPSNNYIRSSIFQLSFFFSKGRFSSKNSESFRSNTTSILCKCMPFLALRTLILKDPRLNFIFCIFGLLTGTKEVYSTCGAQESYSRSLSRVLSVWDDTEIHVWGKCLEELGSVEKCQGRAGGSEMWR